MRKVYTTLLLAFAVAFSSSVSAQGCYPDQQFANDTAGAYPTGPMQMDCSGVSASKSMVFLTNYDFGEELAFLGLDSAEMYFSAARIDSVIGLPAGLQLETDVINSATTESPFGVWNFSGPQFNMTAPVGCISITGPAAAWQAASTSGPNNDGAFDITIYVNNYADTVLNDSQGLFSQLGTLGWGFSGSPFTNNGGTLLELRVNESACNGDISVSAATTGDNPNTTECEGTVSLEVFYGTPPYTFSYSNGGSGATADSLCTGLYTVNVTDANGASGSHQFAIASEENIFINPGFPPAWVDSLFYTTSNCDLDYNAPIDSFMINNAYTIGADTCFVEWVVYQDGSPFTLGSFYPFVGFDPTVFSLTLYCQNGRAETGVFQLYEYLDLSEMQSVTDALAASKLSVYPNPTNGVVSLKSEVLLSEAWLTDLTGRRLMPLISTSTVWQADLSVLPEGIYLVEALSENGLRSTQKVVKQ